MTSILSPVVRKLAAVAGGIVGARNKVLAVAPLIASGEAAKNTACQRTWVF